MALRQIIEFIVRHEVQSFQERQASQVFLSVLSQAEIRAGAEQGRIRMGQPDQMNSSVDAQQAVDTAWQAFEDGMYLVVIDSNEMRDLDTPILLEADSQIVFLRLTFLSGA